MPVLPEKFIARMKQRLPADEWEAFLAVYEQKAVKGVRVNTLKLSPEHFEKIAPFALEKVPYSENAYFVEEEKVGGYAAHFAGLFYSQEPSATAAAPALEISAGERVLDLCSAPGGKGTQAAAYLKGEGLIVLNEPIFSRAQILSSNVERMGVENALVTCEYPEKLAKRFPAYFDKILVDAPCSGEGMFRKNEKEALGEWSEQNVALCAARQKEILGFAYSMLKAGGKMVYSTCTFSEEEDEWQVQDFLSTHPNMRLLRQTKLLPHRQKGEGHFVAVFEKIDGEHEKIKPFSPRISASAKKLWQDFAKDFLKEKRFENLHEVSGVIYALPKETPDFQGLQVLRAGVRLGEIKNGRFEPSHSLAMCLKQAECQNVVDIPETDARADKFLRGETVEDDGKNGWCLVCVGGYSIGLGKRSNGTAKNHIPKPLRKMG